MQVAAHVGAEQAGVEEETKVKLCCTQRVGIIVLLSLVSIPLHEMGHYIVYKCANIPVHVTFQSVHPVMPISGLVAVLGLAGDPAFSLSAALACLLIATQRPGFFWITAAFTNATLRLFPCTMDLLHAIYGKMPFSDEGEIARGLTHSSFARFLVVLCFFAAAATLTVLAGRQYRFNSLTSTRP
ncbi:MAG: hypothetical protein JO249_12205 [Acidobacteria bacterium]|nr:hypothetical protein [Acidobacteriota bacterium]